MSSDFDQLLPISISVEASQPKLLQGLDDWLHLGLIDDEQVKKLSRKYLTCSLPLPKETIASPPETPAEIPAIAPTLAIKQQNLLLRAWQSFQEELSVRWLLFLGVFLVVVSSGVLAATQWQQVSAVGQYGILGIYTVAFWGVSVWARSQSLRLTTRTMQSLFLLLVPINFWAMNTFGLWQNFWGWFVAAIASVSLTAIVALSSRQESQISLPLLTFLGLSYLQWGLGNPDFSWIVVYLGTIGAAVAIYLRSDLFTRQSTRRYFIQIGKGFVIYALSVLLIRAIFVVHVPIQQLGLAIGICGWLLGRTADESQVPMSKIFAGIGSMVLFLGWLVCVDEVAWQAIAVSGLAIHWFAQRLQRYWRRRDLLAIFVIGLQALVLVRELIPPGLGQAALDISIQIAHSDRFPGSVYGITLFPYVILFIWVNTWLDRQEQPKLANFGEWLTLGLGIGLTALSSFNPTWRSLNLFFSSAALLYVTYYRHPFRKALVYLTHLFGLLTICSAIDWWFPSLSQLIWASILLVLMVAEWSIFGKAKARRILPFDQYSLSTWYCSCWYFGLALASISYVLLLDQVQLNNRWGLIWLLTPLSLTSIAHRFERRQRKQAATLSCIALVVAQFLTFEQPEARLVGLGVATGLMFFNTLYLRRTVIAAVHIGFTLSFIAALLWGWLPLSRWFLAGAIAIIGLWIFTFEFRQRSYPLARLYARAADRWAIFLVVVELLLLPLHSLSLALFNSGWEALVTIVLVGGAIVYRYWQQPNTLSIYAFSWAGELFLVESIWLTGGALLAIATANIVLALSTCWLTERLPRQFSPYSRTLAILPLLYAAIGIVCRFYSFTAYTGLLVFGAAITGMRTGYRLSQKWLTAVSLAGISLAIYELVIYQLGQIFSTADRLTMVASVTAGIALTYRIFAWLWGRQGNRKVLNLSLPEFTLVAHLHWAIASLLKLLAASIAVTRPDNFSVIGVAVSLILAAYALIQGRTTPGSWRQDWWVYVGLVEMAATAVYARLIWIGLSILDPWRVILACAIGLTIYQMPWRSFGWRQTPWQRTALTIPALMALVSSGTISFLSLLAVAGFYARVGIGQRNIRWSYISLGFLDWAIALWLLDHQFTEVLWYVAIAGLSILYIAQVEPSLKSVQQRQNRHYLRLFGSTIIGLTALFYQETGLIPALIGLTFVFAGIALSIRAFLFVGTSVFILTVLNQLVVLILTYAFLKWMIGLMAGVVLIAIAANFEQRRGVTVAVQNWLAQLERWE